MGFDLFKNFHQNKNIHFQPKGSNFEADCWAISRFVVEKILPVVSYQPYPLQELMLMVSAMNYFRPDVVFDWGTHLGKSARIFFEASKNFSIKAEIHTFDLMDPAAHNEHPQSELGKFILHIPEVKQHFGDGVTEATKIYRKMKNSSALFFLDGDHSYSSVYRELTMINHHAPTQPMLVHDTLFQSSESKYNVGPWQAIQDFLKNNQYKYQVIETQLGLPGMSLLVPIKV